MTEIRGSGRALHRFLIDRQQKLENVGGNLSRLRKCLPQSPKAGNWGCGKEGWWWLDSREARVAGKWERGPRGSWIGNFITCNEKLQRKFK